MNNKINKLIEEISKERIEELYIQQNLSKKVVAEKLNVKDSTFFKLLKYYNITKDSKLVAEQRKNYCLETYGVLNASQTAESREKISKSARESYSEKPYSELTRVEKIKKTKLERYGSANYNNMDKNRATKKERYGDSKYNNREKSKQTTLEHYGVDNYFKSDEIKLKNIENLCLRKDYNPAFKELINNRDNAVRYLKDKNLTYQEISDIFNLPLYGVSQWVIRLNLQEYIKYSHDGKSSYEEEILDFLTVIGIKNIIRGDRSVLKGSEIDLYLPDYNLGIEFNGNYWHSDIYKNANYHQIKSMIAEENNVRLIHIYQYEWNDIFIQEKIKNLIKSACNIDTSIIYARKCAVKELKNKDVIDFVNNNHIQNHRNAKVTLGLFYQDTLVQMMSFSANRKYDWEIIRSCTLAGTKVIGGASKLFQYFVNTYTPSEVFSYCDFNKFNGKSYEALGMEFLGLTSPDLKYILKDGSVINRSPHRYKELKDNIYASIYGSGSKKYLWKCIK